MRLPFALIALALAPLAPAQILESKLGPVEIIGLEQTTTQQLQSMLERKPDGDLHYCAADLKKGGYAEASVVIHIGEDQRLYTVVTVVERQHATEISRRDRPQSAVAVPKEWTIETAVQVLRDSKESADRAAAAHALEHFADRDAAWQALAAGLRDPDDSVAGACQQSLNSMRRHASARVVDWSPTTADLALLLRGSNLFGFHELLQTLTATGVPLALAPALLGHGGGRMLLAWLRAHHPDERNAAHAFLVQLRGADLGEAVEPWEAWIASL